MVREFKVSINAELDYRQEASNLRTLGEHLADHPALLVPGPIDGYTTARVLTMELVDGQNIGSLGPLARTELDGRPLAETLFRAYLQQILEHGFVHADPHPGNVLLTGDGRLALVDLGMVTRLSASMQDSLIRLLLGISEGNGDQVADVLVAIGTPSEEFDRDGFRRRIGALVLRHQGTTLGELEAGRVVGELAQVASSCGLRPPSELTMLGKALLNLDEVAARLDPDFDPMAVIEDEVGSIMRRKMVRSASPGNLLSAAMEAKEFAERLPGRVNKVMDSLAEGQLTLNIRGIDERELIRGIQKVANRVAAGLVIAALIVGAAMIMQIETEAELLGYPALAIVLFVVASLGGIWLVVTSLRHDV
jgi:predicted unusual protein kinase regulating ubiquinone biosynthesis (AarF/ABC1/UbiB family)